VQLQLASVTEKTAASKSMNWNTAVEHEANHLIDDIHGISARDGYSTERVKDSR